MFVKAEILGILYGQRGLSVESTVIYPQKKKKKSILATIDPSIVIDVKF